MPEARTVEEARAWFERTGQTVTQWAQDHGFSASVVYALLSGRARGRRGNAHRAAVALGIKPKIACPTIGPIAGAANERTRHQGKAP